MESRTDKGKEALGYFPFLVTYREAIDELEEKDQLGLYKAITDYGLFMKEPQTANAVVRAIFKALKPLLDKSHKNRQNGSKGGAPKGNSNASKTSEKLPKSSEKQPKTSEKQPKTSENKPSGLSGDITYNKEPIKPIKQIEPIEQTTNNTEKRNESDVVDVVDVVDGTPRQKVLDSINDYEWIGKFAGQYNVSTIDATDLANRVIADWELSGLADSEWTLTHLLNAMRKKLEADKSLAQSSAPNKQAAKEEWEQGLKAGAVQTISRIYSGVPGTSAPQKDLPY